MDARFLYRPDASSGFTTECQISEQVNGTCSVGSRPDTQSPVCPAALYVVVVAEHLCGPKLSSECLCHVCMCSSNTSYKFLLTLTW